VAVKRPEEISIEKSRLRELMKKLTVKGMSFTRRGILEA
jgi:hypothetical protein